VLHTIRWTTYRQGHLHSDETCISTFRLLRMSDLRQKQIDKRLMRANAKHKTHDYQVSDQVLIKRAFDASPKLEPTYKGPYPIVQVHTNGTVTVFLQPNTMEQYNVHRIT
jgi:hypothetical protein